MSIPFVFDVHSERDLANAALKIGVTQAILAARQADRGDASKGLVGIGDSGSVSQNPLGVGPVPSPAFVQPGTNIAPTTTPVPPRDSNPMRVVASGNYQQPGTANPKPNPSSG